MVFITSISRHFLHQARRISQSALERLKPISNEQLVWRTSENDPTKHTAAHEGLFYILDESRSQAIFGHYSPYDIETTEFYRNLGTMPLMIRRPALSAMKYIEQIQPSMPNVRFLFYGDKGRGKTHTLSHLLHYVHTRQDRFIIHIREMKRFTRSPWGVNASSSRPGRVDTPVNATILLQQFKNQNSHLIEEHKNSLVCSKDYTWSSREVTKAGEPLINVVDHGINRGIHASDCVAVLFNELMLAADAGIIKLATILDNVQFLFRREASVIKHADHKLILVNEITVARALKKLIRGDYKNGIVLATCDDKFSTKQNQLPQDAIGPEGWEHFDPFLPMQVPIYSRKEFESCLNMYQDIGWLTRPESRTQEARDELRFISGMNPGEVCYLCLAL